MEKSENGYVSYFRGHLYNFDEKASDAFKETLDTLDLSREYDYIILEKITK